MNTPTPSPKTAFVTGGTGFIGSHLVEALQARGYAEVRCLVRGDLKWLKGLDVVPVRGDFSSVDVLWEGLRGVDYVYHVAGVTRAADAEAFEQGNVKATLNLLGAVKMAAPSVRKVLLTSSLAAVGPCPGGVATEEAPLRPISRYGRSKAEMERALGERHQMRASFLEDLPLVVVRPPSVYGPREADIFTVFQTASRGLFPIVGSGSKPALSLVHVRDLVRGMIDAAESDATRGQTYFLNGVRDYSWKEVQAAMTEALGRRALALPVPSGLVGLVGAASGLAGRLTGQYPPLNREKAREIREACKRCSDEKARRDFGYRAAVPLEEGMRETVDWYRAEGWLT